jgi:hypothetical protein
VSVAFGRCNGDLHIKIPLDYSDKINDLNSNQDITTNKIAETQVIPCPITNQNQYIQYTYTICTKTKQQAKNLMGNK